MDLSHLIKDFVLLLGLCQIPIPSQKPMLSFEEGMIYLDLFSLSIYGKYYFSTQNNY